MSVFLPLDDLSLRARLLIGPFRSADDADTFAEDLESVDVNAFKWSNSESDTIVPLRTE